MGSRLALYITKKGALDSQPQVIVYQLLAHVWWFSTGTPASSTTKTIAEILLKVALNTINQIKSINLEVMCQPFDQSHLAF